MKVCTRCNKNLPEELFHANRGGRISRCQDCIKQVRAERRGQLQHTFPEVKLCPQCDKTLPATEFSKNLNVITGLQATCRSCTNERNKNRYKNESKTTPTKKRCPRCGQTLAASLFANTTSRRDGLFWCCRECACLITIERQYKIDPDRYREMLTDGCRICGAFEDLHVDHDHSCCPGQTTCGKCVRGILCKDHNLGIGRFHDNPEELLAAVEYLTGNALLRVSV